MYVASSKFMLSDKCCTYFNDLIIIFMIWKLKNYKI